MKYLLVAISTILIIFASAFTITIFCYKKTLKELKEAKSELYFCTQKETIIKKIIETDRRLMKNASERIKNINNLNDFNSIITELNKLYKNNNNLQTDGNRSSTQTGTSTGQFQGNSTRNSPR